MSVLCHFFAKHFKVIAPRPGIRAFRQAIRANCNPSVLALLLPIPLTSPAIGLCARAQKRGMAFAKGRSTFCAPHSNESKSGEKIMNLVVWIPGLFALGLATMALMFAFLEGCDKV